jgi:ferric-dicitrate binding protein FerR (iron transport regulator)
MNPQDLQNALEQYARGAATAQTVQLLEEALRSDPDFRRQFIETLHIDAELAALAASLEGEAPSPPTPVQPPPQTGISQKIRDFPTRLAIAAAAAIAFGAAGMLWMGTFHSPYATVLDSAGTAFQPGESLRGERLRFERGSVQLLTARGARVVVESPAELRFQSAQCLQLWRGKIAAECPPSAHGFTVITPEGRAVDLGTRFGVDVPEKGDPEIHVFEGEVIARPNGSKPGQSLRKGEATALAQGNHRTRELRSSSFIQSDELPHLAAGLAAGQHQRSNLAWTRINQDPALVAAFDFEGGSPPSGSARLAQGRWPGSQAAEFVNVGEHFKTNVGSGQEFSQLTLAAWVRIDRMEGHYQSLYHTDGWNSGNPGQLHWMINPQGSMRLALKGNLRVESDPSQEQYPDSHSAVLSEQGRWMHLATVYDASQRSVRFYLNGKLDGQSIQGRALPARLGPAQIGNWDRSDRKLSGRIDELLILSRSLEDAEINALYESGTPYR